MKAILDNAFAVIAARLILGVVFIVASADKIASPVAFAASISHYQLVSGSLAMVIATVLPWLELISGLSLIFGVFPRGAGFIVACLMVVFTVLVVSALFRGLDITCGCFTQDPEAGKIGWWKVAENSGLLILSFIPTFSRNSALSIETLVRQCMNRPST